MSKLDCEGKAFSSLICALLDPQAVATRIEAKIKMANADLGNGCIRGSSQKILGEMVAFTGTDAMPPFQSC